MTQAQQLLPQQKAHVGVIVPAVSNAPNALVIADSGLLRLTNGIVNNINNSDKVRLRHR